MVLEPRSSTPCNEQVTGQSDPWTGYCVTLERRVWYINMTSKLYRTIFMIVALLWDSDDWQTSLDSTMSRLS